MKKSIRKYLRVAGAVVLSLAIVLTSCRSEETTKKKKTKKTTDDETETTVDPSDDPTDPTDDPTDPTDPTTPSVKTYTGAEAGIRLHELDEEVFMYGMDDTDIMSLYFDIENPETFGVSWPEKGIEPWTPEDDGTDKEFIQHVLDTLDEIEFNDLELEDQVLFATMKRDFELSLEMYDMNYYTSSINSLTGINVDLPILFATLIFDDVADAERYLTMLADVEEYLGSLLLYEQMRAEKGWSLPDEILEGDEGVLHSIEVVFKDHEGNYMYTTFEERVNALNTDDATKQDLIKRNKEILDNSFFPGYEALYEGMKELVGTAKTSGKICEMEGGKEFYEKFFQYRSGTNLTIPEAKAVLEQAMYDDIMELQTLYAGMTDEQIKQLDLDHEYSKGTFEENVEYCKEIIKTDFPDIGDVKYIAYHIPEEMKDNAAPAAYVCTPIDDINKNVLLINDYSDGVGGLLPTVAHESFPGHLFQTVYQLQNLNNYYQKGMSIAYMEGWSTYCEDYIIKLTDYDYDVYHANYIYMDLILNYIISAYVDICVHYDGWGKDEIADYYEQFFGKAMAKRIADAYYDMTIEIPFYAAPYTFGNIYCNKIIDDAVEQFGGSYSMKEIHTAYLDMGQSYFELLQEYMPAYVERQH